MTTHIVRTVRVIGRGRWLLLFLLMWGALRWSLHPLGTPRPASTALPANIIGLAAAPPIFVVRRLLPLPFPVQYPAASALATAGLYLMWRIYRRAGARWSRRGHDPSRRRFLLRAGTGGVALGAAGAVAEACVAGPLRLRVAAYDIPIDDLPPELDGVVIAHLSDWHAGPRVPREVLELATRRALEMKPDLVAFTGDYAHRTAGQLEALRPVLAPLLEPGVSRFGVVGVLGNHDYYDDHRAVASGLRAMGVRMIDNERVFLTPAGLRDAPAPGSVCVAGLADPWMDEPDPAAALGGVPAETPRVVLAHQPDTAERPGIASPGSPRVDLMLSGHTHGGQVALPLIGTPVVPSRFGQKYAGGLVRGPAFPVVVSRGIGMSVLPVRFGVPPEVGRVRLIAKKKQGKPEAD